VFFNWLVTVFPIEMRDGWCSVRADLLQWLAIAIAFGLAALYGDGTSHPESAAVLYISAMAAAVLVTLMAADRFRAVSRGVSREWSETLGSMVGRFVPLALAWLLAAGVSAGVAVIAQTAVIILLRNTDAVLPASWAMQKVVYWTLMTRFCFVPFLTALNRRRELDPARTPGLTWPAPLPRLMWPLAASSAMSDGLRWRLAPYLVLALEAPAAVLLAPAALRLPLLVLLQLVSFTALAVLFGYYERRLPVVLETRSKTDGALH
jgi:hypothetical protein